LETIFRSTCAAKDVSDILSSIKTVVVDADWDGISSAIQIKMHYPHVEIKITNTKKVPSDINTLVIDQGTDGEGWLIDHHPLNGNAKNLLNFCESGELPASTLTYNILPEKNNIDLLLSATAEITDGLYDYGFKHGSLKLLMENQPVYFKNSRLRSQFLMDKEIFIMADIFASLALHMPDSTLRIGLEAYQAQPQSSEELKALLNGNELKLVDDYFAFMENFPENLFQRYLVNGYSIQVANAESIGKFSLFAMERTRAKYPGNYLLLNGSRISMRTNDAMLFNTVRTMLDERVLSYGGRKEWHGIRLKEKLDYQEFVSIIEKTQGVVNLKA
jgi:hypothetical protein